MFDHVNKNFKNKFLEQERDRANEARNAMLANGEAVDTQVATPTDFEVLLNTSKTLKVFIRGTNATNTEAPYVFKVKKTKKGYDYYYDGDLLMFGMSAKRLLWEFDSVFVAFRDAGIKPKCIDIPDDLETEPFMRHAGNLTVMVQPDE